MRYRKHDIILENFLKKQEYYCGGIEKSMLNDKLQIHDSMMEVHETHEGTMQYYSHSYERMIQSCRKDKDKVYEALRIGK